MKVESRRNRWQMALFLLMGVFLIALVATMALAGRRVSPVVDQEYYDHGLQYGESIRKSCAQGWTLTPFLAQTQLQVQVRDQAGLPVTGGRLIYEPRQGKAGQTASFSLSETAPGIYRMPLKDEEPGAQHGTLRFTKNDASLSSKLVLFH